MWLFPVDHTYGNPVYWSNGYSGINPSHNSSLLVSVFIIIITIIIVLESPSGGTPLRHNCRGAKMHIFKCFGLPRQSLPLAHLAHLGWDWILFNVVVRVWNECKNGRNEWEREWRNEWMQVIKLQRTDKNEWIDCRNDWDSYYIDGFC